MAHNSYIRAGAVWANGSAVTSAELAAFDVAQFKSGNLDDGGTWSPAAAIVIGGLGIDIVVGSVSGDLTVPSAGEIAFNAGSFLNLSGTMTVAAAGTITIQSGSEITLNSGAALACNGNATFAGTLTLSTTADIALGSVSVTRCQEGTPSAPQTDWMPVNDGGGNMRWSNLLAAKRLILPLDLPDGCTLTAVAVNITGAAGHAALPSPMPKIQIRKMSATGTASVIGAQQTDGSVDVAAYQVQHSITNSGLSEVIDRATTRYSIELLSEGAGDFVSAMLLQGWTATYTVTKYDRGVG